jgi:preprotein translocase subunit SecE
MSVARTTPAEFVRQVRREASKVAWPTRKETLVSTAMVLVMVLIASLFFLLVDNVVAAAVKALLGLGA